MEQDAVPFVYSVALVVIGLRREPEFRFQDGEMLS
jgi:hypothetical protein